MQKKIIALAVAGLVSGAAFAESNVVISGIVDVGYQYSSDALAHGLTRRLASCVTRRLACGLQQQELI